MKRPHRLGAIILSIYLAGCEPSDMVESNNEQEITQGRHHLSAIREAERTLYCNNSPKQLVIRSANMNETIFNRSPQDAMVLPWAFMHAKSGGLLNSEFNDAIRHEFGHLLLREHYKERNAKASEYGTNLPDWIDEISAIAFDTKQTRNRRTTQFLRAYKGELPSTLPCILAHDRAETTRAKQKTNCKGNQSVHAKHLYAQYTAVFLAIENIEGKPCLLAKILKRDTHSLRFDKQYNLSLSSINRIENEIERMVQAYSAKSGSHE
ncbi:hypothetical protein [uncultured Pseudoteredinibacter sp.]|uniref:hypothetical protein n=1 Tax=uncultured Pseudoteredinibacter sp. TaxID=1641701 RepID=UPI0026318A25|nr:hypothetical protein [uncultured Pseudoteredinibacter sp.]